MINETLKERLPALPKGWRWRVEKDQIAMESIYPDCVELCLDKKVGVIGKSWIEIANIYAFTDLGEDEINMSYSIDKEAERLYNRFINNQEEVDDFLPNPLEGVTDE